MKEFEGCNVLLADDDEITRKLVANIVEDLGAACETAQNGTELIRKLNGANGEKFDLVLTDINMPQKGGIEACAEFRASSHPKAKTLPFIGMLDDTNRALFDRAISAGMNSMTLKPITRDVLYAHFILTLRDNQANTIFCERVQEAIASAKAKSYFFSTVSHDIRTPLNAIIGFSQMLKMGFKTEEERNQALDAILTSGKTLLQLINDILDLSKLESGKMTIEPAPTSCQKLLKEVVDSFRISAQHSNVEIRCKAEGIPQLLLDPQRLRQIVFNLVGNAYKFTKEGFIEVRAQFDREPGKPRGTFRLDVEDTGCGISEEDMERIASPYVQVGSAKSRNGGTGLGLAICRQLVDAMGGELELASEVGVGTVFSMILPNVPVCMTDGWVGIPPGAACRPCAAMRASRRPCALRPRSRLASAGALVAHVRFCGARSAHLAMGKGSVMSRNCAEDSRMRARGVRCALIALRILLVFVISLVPWVSGAGWRGGGIPRILTRKNTPHITHMFTHQTRSEFLFAIH